MMQRIAVLALLPLLACGGRAATEAEGAPRMTPSAGSGGARAPGEEPPPTPQAGGAQRDPEADGGATAAGGAPSAAGASSSAGANAAGASSGGASAAGAGGADDAAGASSGGAGTAGAAPTITRTLIDEPSRPRGFLSALQYLESNDALAYDVQAMFEISRGQWDGCTRVQLGSCWYYDCPPGSSPYLPGGPVFNAGALSLATAGSTPRSLGIELIDDFYYQRNELGELWSATGQTLTFSTTGSPSGMIPPFILAVATPPSITLLGVQGEPVKPVGMSVTRGEGAMLRWHSSGPGVARFTIIALVGQQYAAECDFDASAEAGTMPPEILQALQPGSDYRLLLRGISTVRTEAAGWALEASLLAHGVPLSPFDPPQLVLR